MLTRDIIATRSRKIRDLYIVGDPSFGGHHAMHNYSADKAEINLHAWVVSEGLCILGGMSAYTSIHSTFR